MAATSFRAWDARDVLMMGSPAGTLLENFERGSISGDLVAALSTGVMTSVAVPLVGGDIVTSISFLSGATAAITPTAEWAALYGPFVSGSSTPKLGQSTSVSSAWAASTLKTFTLAAQIVIPTTGVYFVAVMVAAATVPTLVGKELGIAIASSALVTGMPNLSQTSGSALAATSPGTIVTPTAISAIPYCIIQ